jgi:hypothetical protein
MKLGMKQKAYGVVLGLAAIGFVVDRLFFEPPDSEAANVAPAHPGGPAPGAASAAGQAPASTAGPGDAQPVPAGWLAERLRKAAPAVSDNDLRDVFAAPAGWRPAPKPVVVATPAPAVPKPQPLGPQFLREHHLIAVFIEGKNGRALVDGQLVPVGGSVAGFRLVAVNQRSAQFTHGDEQVSLTLADSDAGAVR